jgi:hypothetical protein
MAIYKYCKDPGKFIILNLEIKVTPANELEDKYEMRPLVRSSNPIATAERFLAEALADPSFFNSNAGLFGGKNFSQFKGFVNAHRTGVIALLAKASVKLDDNLQKHFVDILSAKWGVVSLTDSPVVDSMWDNYADGHKGLIVELAETSAPFVNYTCVKCDYSDTPVVYDRFLEVNHESMKQIVRQKKMAFKYENETRLIIPLTECRKKPCGISTLNLFRLDASAIVSVTFGLRTPDPLKKEVLTALTRPELQHVTKWQMGTTDGGAANNMKWTQLP